MSSAELSKIGEYEMVQEKVRDYSGLNYTTEVYPLIKDVASVAEKIAVFPDLSPTEPGVVPTGSVTEINILKHPDWLKWVRSADIGCGFLYTKFESTSAEDVSNTEELQKGIDEVATLITKDPKWALGGGNHFMDIVTVEDTGEAGVVIHTGSPRDSQKSLSADIVKMLASGKWDTDAYMKAYGQVVEAAHENRLALLKMAEKVFGKSETMFHMPHNTIEIDRSTGLARIYKGANHITQPNQRILLPSSMEGYMDFYLPGPNVGAPSLNGTSHGTGRAIKRSEMKGMELPRPNILTAYNIEPPITEKPAAYRPLGEVEKIMEENGMMKPLENEDDITLLKPKAYIGHLA